MGPQSRTLVVDKELLGYDLLLGLDAITQLGSIAMSGTGEVRFPQHRTLICAAITLDEPDFHAEYDEGKCRRTFSVCGKLVGHFPVCGWLRVGGGGFKTTCNLFVVNMGR